MEKIWLSRVTDITQEEREQIWAAAENGDLTSVLPAVPVAPLKGRGCQRYRLISDLKGLAVVPAAHKVQIWERERGRNYKVWCISPEVARIYNAVLGAV